LVTLRIHIYGCMISPGRRVCHKFVLAIRTVNWRFLQQSGFIRNEFFLASLPRTTALLYMVYLIYKRFLSTYKLVIYFMYSFYTVVIFHFVVFYFAQTCLLKY